MKNERFTLRDQFYLDGEPFRIISGALHYFRVVPEYWRDRLQKLKAMGCNTVETYLPWNLHEPKQGRFCFTGGLDIKAFLEMAQSLGLWAIVRPSPYICGEWEFGGLPAWLLAGENIRLRSSEGPFLDYVREYYEALFPLLIPLQVTRGGPILLMQVENEYGAFGSDKAYLTALRDDMRRLGTEVPLITSDGPWEDYLACGSVPGAHPTANFGSKAAEQFSVLEQHTNGGSLMCTEFWDGWFDAWGDEVHHTTDARASAAELDEILRRGSVNFYMFHGGTNFGFMNGANDYGHLTPDVTSYDYDAPLSESGEPTEKFHAYRAVIGKYVPLSAEVPQSPVSIAYGTLTAAGRVSLFASLDRLSAPAVSVHPRSMERLGQSYGYLLYRTELSYPAPIQKARLTDANDRAQFFLNGLPVLTLYDRELEREHAVAWDCAQPARLDILMENMGRVNYGPLLNRQRKGIDGDVLLNGRAHPGWTQYPLPLEAEALARLDFSLGWEEGEPAFYRFLWEAEELGDTFLDFSGWGKGAAFLNGFNLGRFWEKGPQKRLYIPAPLLKRGRNELILFETEGKAPGLLTLTDKPNLG